MVELSNTKSPYIYSRTCHLDSRSSTYPRHTANSGVPDKKESDSWICNIQLAQQEEEFPQGIERQVRSRILRENGDMCGVHEELEA